MKRMRLMIVDDHEVVRLGLQLLQQNRPEFELVDEAESGAQALSNGGTPAPRPGWYWMSACPIGMGWRCAEEITAAFHRRPGC